MNIDDCANQPCENDGVCTDEVAGFTCDCADGFAGDTCAVNIDDCAQSSIFTAQVSPAKPSAQSQVNPATSSVHTPSFSQG